MMPLDHVPLEMLSQGPARESLALSAAGCMPTAEEPHAHHGRGPHPGQHHRGSEHNAAVHVRSGCDATTPCAP